MSEGNGRVVKNSFSVASLCPGKVTVNSGELFGWEKTWINRSLCPKIDEYDFSCESLYRIFRDVYNIQPSYAEGVLEVLIAERSLAKLFQIREGTPLFSARRTIFTKTHQPIQVNHEIYRGDRYSFDIKVGKL